jgi:hypothetical protein
MAMKEKPKIQREQLSKLSEQAQDRAELSRQWMQRFAASQWKAVFRGDGKIGYCSCGRPLERIDASTFRCSSGFPVYSLREGSVFKDKFGQLYIAPIPHNDEQAKHMRENTTETEQTGMGKRL